MNLKKKIAVISRFPVDCHADQTSKLATPSDFHSVPGSLLPSTVVSMPNLIYFIKHFANEEHNFSHFFLFSFLCLLSVHN